MVELRKRPSRDQPPAQPAAKRGSGAGAKMKKVVEKAKEVVGAGAPAGPPDGTGPAPKDEVAVTKATGVLPETTTTAADGSENVGAPVTSRLVAANGATTSKLDASSVGKPVNLDGFGGTITTHDGVETTFKELLDKSAAGVVVFTYPCSASTPGCTTQACLFRDSYAPITGASFAVYGLSTDSAKANTTFVNKHSLPYTLLCDPNATLTSAIGMRRSLVREVHKPWCRDH
ncbi:hypothetical protein ABVK25_012378 [Lepraria finkii]|uniref:Alkyl hydroperoxide reductase subunit C/ Thiol specific antioxidant domain-containing protein n=1 Tax=Lepraria finkii TaxID=1340010 RepID=A0ABR4AH95_9LECA